MANDPGGAANIDWIALYGAILSTLIALLGLLSSRPIFLWMPDERRDDYDCNSSHAPWWLELKVINCSNKKGLFLSHVCIVPFWLKGLVGITIRRNPTVTGGVLEAAADEFHNKKNRKLGVYLKPQQEIIFEVICANEHPRCLFIFWGHRCGFLSALPFLLPVGFVVLNYKLAHSLNEAQREVEG